jgi:hypothetical protein
VKRVRADKRAFHLVMLCRGEFEESEISLGRLAWVVAGWWVVWIVVGLGLKLVGGGVDARLHKLSTTHSGHSLE